MAASVAVLASLGLLAWLIYRIVKGKPIKAYAVSYGVSCVAGVFTLAFFLSMDMPQLLKIVVSILLGIALIILAAYLQRRRQSTGS